MVDMKNIKSFNELIQVSEVPVLVDFWAEWCKPCLIIAPLVKRIAREYSGKLTVVKINVDQKPQIASQYGIRSIPTVMMFWKGQVLMRQMGAVPYEQLKSQIELHWPQA
jgi:thioredoxin